MDELKGQEDHLKKQQEANISQAAAILVPRFKAHMAIEKNGPSYQSSNATVQLPRKIVKQ